MLCTCMTKVQAAAYIALDKNLPEYSQEKKSSCADHTVHLFFLILLL